MKPTFRTDRGGLRTLPESPFKHSTVRLSPLLTMFSPSYRASHQNGGRSARAAVPARQRSTRPTDSGGTSHLGRARNIASSAGAVRPRHLCVVVRVVPRDHGAGCRAARGPVGLSGRVWGGVRPPPRRWFPAQGTKAGLGACPGQCRVLSSRDSKRSGPSPKAAPCVHAGPTVSPAAGQSGREGAEERRAQAGGLCHRLAARDRKETIRGPSLQRYSILQLDRRCSDVRLGG